MFRHLKSDSSTLNLIDLESIARRGIFFLILASAIRLVTAITLGWTDAIPLSGASFSSGVLGYILAAKGFPKSGLILVLFGTISSCGVSAYSNEGLGNVGIPIIGVIVVFSGFLFDTTLLLLVSGYGMLMICGVSLGRTFYRGIPFNESDAGDLVILLSTVMVAALVGHLVSRQVLRSFEEAVESQRKLRESAEALSNSEQRWQLALLGANDGIWDWQIDSGEIFFSDRWKGILGYEPSELEESRDVFQSLVHPQDLPMVQTALDAHLRGETAFYSVEYRMRAKSGEYRWILARGRALFDEGNRAIRFCGSHTDISERKHAEAELVAANAAKSTFLANMSHEIRTPLNAVTGMSDLLEQSHLSAEQRDIVSTIQTSSRLLLSIINNVLDYSKIERGQFHLDETAFELRKLIDSTLGILSIEAKRKGISLTAEIAPAIDSMLIADSTCLQQVLVNLLSNSVKFTNEGYVCLRVKLDADPKFIYFEVADSGIGLSAETANRLFEDFYQGDASITRRYGGTGLGLAITRRLVRLMGGEIGIQEPQGQGAVFWFTLPRKETILAAELVGGDDSFKRYSYGLRVLLAEDNLVNQKVASAILAKLGCSVEVAADGRQAIELFVGSEFDLILMDCHMPNMDGFSATREIRALGARGENVPIIALTADVLESSRERCLEAGMNDYLSKPIDLERLRLALRQSRG